MDKSKGGKSELRSVVERDYGIVMISLILTIHIQRVNNNSIVGNNIVMINSIE